MKRTCSLVLTVTLLAVSPLAVSQDEGEEIAEEEQPVCINTNMVRSFDAFNDHYVYVRQGASQHFLLTMRNRCIETVVNVQVVSPGLCPLATQNPR